VAEARVERHVQLGGLPRPPQIVVEDHRLGGAAHAVVHPVPLDQQIHRRIATAVQHKGRRHGFERCVYHLARQSDGARCTIHLRASAREDVQEEIRFALDAGFLQEGERRAVDALQVVLGEGVQDSAFGACLHDGVPFEVGLRMANGE
jgi:hypothetical protein